MPRTAARKKANDKWNAENLETLGTKHPKGTKKTWKVYAEKAGVSLAKFVTDAIEEKAERDGLKSEQGQI